MVNSAGACDWTSERRSNVVVQSKLSRDSWNVDVRKV